MCSSRVQEVVVVELVVVRRNLALDLRGVHPGDEVLEVSRHQIRRVSHRLWSNPNVPLLNERDGFAKGLSHLTPHHDHRQTPAAKGGGRQLITQRQRLLGRDGAHVVEFLEQRVGKLEPRRIPGVELLEDADELGDHAAELVVLFVVVAILQVIPAHHFDLAVVVLGLSLEEVHLLEELLLVILELPHDVVVVLSSKSPGVVEPEERVRCFFFLGLYLANGE